MADRPRIAVTRSIRFPGHMFGLRLPCLGADIQIAGLDGFDLALSDLIARLTKEFRPLDAETEAQIPARIEGAQGKAVFALAHLSAWVQNEIGVPSVGQPVLFRQKASQNGDTTNWRVYLPSLAPAAADAALHWFCDAVTDSAPFDRAIFADRIEALFSDVGAHVTQGVNTREMIRAALALDIPVTPRAAGMWQYGLGKNARVFSSSLTENTPSVGVRAARSKSAANAFLRQAGLPVPAQQIVHSEDDALHAAEKIGYPVVVKPSDLDGGVGVSAGLDTEAATRSAYHRARAHSDRIVVEACIAGNDYRINVFGNTVMLATQRVAANIIGDGQSTIEQLVAQKNRDPRRRPEKWFQMKPLVLDQEALELLQEQGLTRDSVPAADRFVPLRRAANTSSGGELIPATDRMHPENAALAIRAAKALRLDLAGIDLITEDIARPWFETGGALCEVNAQVQFGFSDKTQYDRVISGIVRGNGRIPIVVIMTTEDRAGTIFDVKTLSEALPEKIGYKMPDRAYIDRSVMIPQANHPFSDTRAVLANTEIDGAVIVLTDTAFADTGLPFDRFDMLVVDRPVSEMTQQATRLLALCSAHCAGPVLIREAAMENRMIDVAKDATVALLHADDWPTEAIREIAAVFAANEMTG